MLQSILLDTSWSHLVNNFFCLKDFGCRTKSLFPFLLLNFFSLFYRQWNIFKTFLNLEKIFSWMLRCITASSSSCCDFVKINITKHRSFALPSITANLISYLISYKFGRFISCVYIFYREFSTTYFFSNTCAKILENFTHRYCNLVRLIFCFRRLFC